MAMAKTRKNRNTKENKTKDKNKKERSSHTKLGGSLFKKMVCGGAAELRSNAEEVNRLNVFPVPDGDTGDNMSMTIESGVKAIEGLDTDDLAEVMRVLSHGMLLGARGNSGVILSQFFAGVASGFENSKDADPKTLGAALELGVKQAYSTVMTPTEGTILTVAREAVEYAVSKITPKTTIKSFFANFVKELHASVERTPERLPALKEAGVVDSGGAGLFYIMDGFMRVLNGEEIKYTKTESTAKITTESAARFNEYSEMTYAYCTELLVQLMRSKCNIEAFSIDALRNYLSDIGDSVAVIKSGSVIKLHVHTYSPEKVLALMREYGEFINVKIENMSLQHTESMIAKETTKKKYGIVAVSSGDGIDKIFRELGADETVLGGQTNNPSASDFIRAFDKIEAEYIFVFPNNSNIILAAEQAASMYKKCPVFVIKTKCIGTGYAALSVMNTEEDSPEKIIDSAYEAIERVRSGYISPAIRDTDIDGIHINSGDTIGIIDKKIVVDEKSRIDAAAALGEILLLDKFMLTIFVGKDIETDEKNELIRRIQELRPDSEIYAIDAGQAIFPFIFISE